MRSAEGKRFIYEKAQLIEVICQLRYPAILSIDTKEPADFQETVREDFPRYLTQVERLASPGPGQKAQEVTNHSFLTEDGSYKISMTKNFIALSTMRYAGWEEFAKTLDEPLGHFISIYRPAYFERVGLRYVNGVSRSALGLEERRWNDLFQPQYLGVLDDDAIDEKSVSKCAVELEMRLDERTALKLHAGPASVKRTLRTPEGLKTVQEKETRFIFDQDLFVQGKVKLPEVTETLEALHGHADRIFSDAITDVLHDAMEAVEL